MRIFLLAPYPEISNIATTQYPPLGILYIGGAVCDMADDMQILDANILKLSITETTRRIQEFKPDIVGISVNVVTAKAAKEIAQAVKDKMPDVKLAAGGPLPTICPDEWLDHFDIVIAGEGELPFRHIIKGLKSDGSITDDCAGICLRNNKHTKAMHPNLDELSFPAYDFLVPELQYYSKKARVIKSFMAPLLTSRGCPYGCIFCDKSVHGTNFRARSAESVINEVKWLYEKYGVRQLDILDDNFTFAMGRAEKILNGMIEIDHFAINCQNGIRADRININLVKKMKEAGIFRVGIGIESGNPTVLKKLNKNLDLDNVIEAINLFRSQRITVHGYFMIGFPFENKQLIEDTIQFAVKANPHFANFSHFFPIIGTSIYKDLEKKEQLLNKSGEVEDGFYRSNSHFNSDKITPEKMKKVYSQAWRKFYFRPYKILDILLSIKSWKELIWVTRIALSMMSNKLLK